MPTANCRILIVDDFEISRIMLKDCLKQLNMINIEMAIHGKDALDKLYAAIEAGNPFELVFCDWTMPEMDGRELLEKVRADARLRSVPFVMVTAESEQDSIFKALLAGATDYVIKPFSAFTIKSKVEKLFKQPNKKVS